MSDIIQRSKVLAGSQSGFQLTTTFDSATLSWVAAVVANGGTVSDARKALVNSLIQTLRANGTFTKWDGLWIHAAENEPQALTSIAAGNITAVVANSPTFTIDRGYGGQVATAGMTLLNPVTQGTLFIRDNASLFMWTTHVGGDVDYAMYQAPTSTVTVIYPNFTGFDLMFLDINSTVDDPTGAAVTGGVSGLYAGTRSNSTTLNYYQNGVNKGFRTDTSVAVVNDNINLRVDTYPGDFAASGIGALLSDTEMTNFYNSLRTYMTAVGVP